MAIVNTPYTQALKVLTGEGNWLSNSIKLAILTSGYVFSSSHTAFDNGANDATDPSFSELPAGDGYTTGGVALTSKTITDGAISAASVTFPFTAQKTFRQAVLYIDGTIMSIANPLLIHVLFDDTAGGTDITVPGTDFVFNWNPSGVATLTVV